MGCSAGSYYEQHLSPREDIDLFIINTEADGMQALMQDKIDIFVTDEVMLTPESMRMYGVKKVLRGEESFDVAVAVRKGNTQLLEQLNAFIAQPYIPDLVNKWTEGASVKLPPSGRAWTRNWPGVLPPAWAGRWKSTSRRLAPP